jgi:hypothetical protein
MQNFMPISKLVKSCKKIDAQKGIDKNVMEKCTFTHVHQKNWFPYNFLSVHFFATFSTVLKSA